MDQTLMHGLSDLDRSEIGFGAKRSKVLNHGPNVQISQIAS